MILKYTLTDKMISFVISISEKIGQIKEIRSSHKHIDFDMMCNVKNIQNALQIRGMSYPNHIIAELMESKSSSIITSEDNRIVKEEVSKYLRVKNGKSYHPANFKDTLHRAGQEKPEPQLPKEVITKLTSSDKFFLYRVAEFCDGCNVIGQNDLMDLWLTTLFLKEYDILLYFPYNDVLALESSVIVKGKRLIDKLKHETSTQNRRYLLIEFYLGIINSVLQQCLEVHYKLSKPIAGRVEMLRGKIAEPFSRKDYMGYYKISNPSASLDLKKAVENGILIMEGDKRNARYWYRGNNEVEVL